MPSVKNTPPPRYIDHFSDITKLLFAVFQSFIIAPSLGIGSIEVRLNKPTKTNKSWIIMQNTEIKLACGQKRTCLGGENTTK